VGAELDGVGGLYLEDCNQAVPMDPAAPMQGVAPYAIDPSEARKLWDLSARVTGVG
jgi:hypothetical protein